MLEVKDEILSGEARYRLRNKNGDIVLDDLTIDQITALLQVGTDINKKLFDSIHDHLILTSKYHLLQGTIESDYITPALTSDNPQGHIVEWEYINIDNTYTNVTDAYQMFGGDGSGTLSFYRTTGASYSTTITLPKPVKITQVGGWRKGTTGSNTNESYIYVRVLGKLNENDAFEEIVPKYYDGFGNSKAVSKNKAYKYVKFEFTAVDSKATSKVKNGLYVKGKAIDEATVTEEIVENLNEMLTKGQIIQVETKNDYSMCQNVTYKIRTSDEQAVSLPSDLVAGQRYRLVYNGTEFEHENIYKDVQLTNAIVALGGSV